MILIMEEVEFMQLSKEVERRVTRPDRKTISYEEILDRLGLTQEDVDNAEDLEID